MMWIKRAPLLMLICLMAVKFSGCVLGIQGGLSQVTCPVGQINVTQFDPFSHVYQLSGGCTIEGEDVNYYVAAYWYPNNFGMENTFEALVVVNALGDEYKAIVRAVCPNGDPLLYGDSGCFGRSFEDKKGNIPSEFREAFENSVCPFLLTPDWIAALTARDKWDKNAQPTLWVPSEGLPPNFRYLSTPPDNVPILFELPLSYVEWPFQWKLFFTYQKWDSGIGDWVQSDEIAVTTTQGSNGRYYARKTLSLEKGKYRFLKVRYAFDGGRDRKWESNEFFMSKEFHVGAAQTAKMPKLPREFMEIPGTGASFDHMRPGSIASGSNEKPFDYSFFEKMPVPKPAIFLSGKKIYGSKEKATFMVQGEVRGKPMLEFSPDGVRWSSKAPKSSMVKLLGNRAQQRCELEADTPGWYRVRFADILISEPIQVSKEMALAHQAEAKSIKKVDPILKPDTQKMTQVNKKIVEPGIVSAPALFLSGKKSYSPKENVMFTLQGEPKGEPVIECSQDGLRWGTNCPKEIRVRKTGTGVQARYMVAASEPGRYRLKLGDVISEPFEVKPALGSATALPGAKSPVPSKGSGFALTPAAKTPVALSGPGSSVKTPATAAPTLVPVGSPSIRLNTSNLTAPAKVRLNVQADPKFKAHYVLEKKENGVFREIAHSDQPEFQVNDPGDYRVKAQYLNGAFGNPVAFSVKPKITAHPEPAAQPLKTKIPAKTKKMIQ